MNTKFIRNKFIELYENEEFFVDRETNTTMLEIIGASFVADARCIFGEQNFHYMQAEKYWYTSESTNINDLYQGKPSKLVPSLWQAVANRHGEINSNYGHLIFSEKYYSQRTRALNELIANSASRRATMVYTRPSIWTEYNENGKNDFICTNAVSYYIRNKEMHCVVQMRSNDAVYGYKNDYFWQWDVLEHMVEDYNEAKFAENPDHWPIGIGEIRWQVQNLHVYSRNFNLITEAIATRDKR